MATVYQVVLYARIEAAVSPCGHTSAIRHVEAIACSRRGSSVPRSDQDAVFQCAIVGAIGSRSGMRGKADASRLGI